MKEYFNDEKQRWISENLRVRFFTKIKDWIIQSEKGFCVSSLNRSIKITRINVHQRNHKILAYRGFFGSFDAPWSERSGINLLRKETENPFSDLKLFKNPILDFPKKCAVHQGFRCHLSFVPGPGGGGGGYFPEKLGRGVRPASQNTYPIYDQNLRYSLPYLWPKLKFETLFMTCFSRAL